MTQWVAIGQFQKRSHRIKSTLPLTCLLWVEQPIGQLVFLFHLGKGHTRKPGGGENPLMPAQNTPPCLGRAGERLGGGMGESMCIYVCGGCRTHPHQSFSLSIPHRNSIATPPLEEFSAHGHPNYPWGFDTLLRTQTVLKYFFFRAAPRERKELPPGCMAAPRPTCPAFPIGAPALHLLSSQCLPGSTAGDCVTHGSRPAKRRLRQSHTWRNTPDQIPDCSGIWMRT